MLCENCQYSEAELQTTAISTQNKITKRKYCPECWDNQMERIKNIRGKISTQSEEIDK